MSDLERRDFLKGCFFAAAGLGLAATKAGALEPLTESPDLPKAEILNSGAATTYLRGVSDWPGSNEGPQCLRP